MPASKVFTSATGAPVADNTNIMTAGRRGPALLQDIWLIEKIAHFDRELIPERRMHADVVGNNTPVFFFRDPLRFPDLNHAIKRDPRTGLRSAGSNWDFWTLLPEALHQVTIVMSDRGIPKSFRHMHLFGSHSFSMINAANDRVPVKFHFRTQQGIANLADAEAAALIVNDRESHGRMRTDGNLGGTLSFHRNGAGLWANQPDFAEPPMPADGDAAHWDHRVDDDHWEQPGNLFRGMTPAQRQALFENTARAMGDAPAHIKQHHVENCTGADPAYAAGVARALGLER